MQSRLSSSKKAIVLIISILLLALFVNKSLAEDSWWLAVEEENSGSIVFITATVTAKNGAKTVTTGTGFIVHPKGWVLTCNHVIPKIEANETLSVILRVSGREQTPYRSKTMRRDEQNDLALLKLPEVASKPWRSVSSLGKGTKGTTIVAIGFPLNEEIVSKPGQISSTDAYDNGEWLTAAALNPGMSGGPVFDKSGHVVAVSAGGHQQTEGLNLIIPISFAKSLLANIDSPVVLQSKPDGIPVLLDDSVRTTAGDSFDYAISASGSPTAYRAKDLPPSLSLDGKTGVISGDIDDDAKSLYRVQLGALNGAGWGKAILTIRVKHETTGATGTVSSPPTPVIIWQLIIQNTVFRVQNVNVFAPNGQIVGHMENSAMPGSIAVFHWNNNSASYLLNDGKIVNVYPGGTTVVGRWQ